MPAAFRNRNPRTELADAPQVSASDAKNRFGRMLDRVAKEGPLAITKHHEPCAVLISIDEYRTLIGAGNTLLNTLTEEFDVLFDRMQKPGAAEAMQKAFAMSPEQLGRAAVKDAAKAAQRRRDEATRSVPPPVPVRPPSAKVAASKAPRPRHLVAKGARRARA